MQKQPTYRIVPLLLALMMLLTTSGFSINLHFCGNSIKSFSILGDAKACHEIAATCSASHGEKASKHCCSAKKVTDQKEKDNCCSNKQVILKMDIDAADMVNAALTSTNVQFVCAFISTFCGLYSTPYSSLPPHSNYKSPLLSRDILLLVQTFLL